MYLWSVLVFQTVFIVNLLGLIDVVDLLVVHFKARFLLFHCSGTKHLIHFNRSIGGYIQLVSSEQQLLTHGHISLSLRGENSNIVSVALTVLN